MSKTGAVLVCLMLAACSGGSPDNRYFTLAPVGPSAAPPPGKPPLRLSSLHLPSIYDRPQLVVRTGPQSVELDEFDRWAEPLERMTARTLAQDIGLRRPRPSLSLPAEESRLSIVIDEFAADRDGRARLTGRWKISDAAGGSEAGEFSYAMPVDSRAPEGIAAAMSALLGQLADEIDKR